MESGQVLDQGCASHKSHGERGDRRNIDSVRNTLNGKIARAMMAGMAICFSAGQALAYQSGKGGESLATNGDICYNNVINSNLTKTNMPLPKGPTQLNDNPEGQDDKKENNEDKEHEIGSDKYKSVKDNFKKLSELVEGLPERKGTKSVGVYTFKRDHGIRVKKMGFPDTLVFAIDAADDDRFKMNLNKNEMAYVRFGQPEPEFREGGPIIPGVGASEYLGRNESSFQSKLDHFVKLISDENAKNEEEKRKKDDKKKKEDDKKVKEFRT